MSGALTPQSPNLFFLSAPSVLYFSIHRYEQGRFWPHLKASNWSTTGFGQGQGYTINVPWNQVSVCPLVAPRVKLTPSLQWFKAEGRTSHLTIVCLCLQVGMRDADYIAAFLQILLPVALEVRGSGMIWCRVTVRGGP